MPKPRILRPRPLLDEPSLNEFFAAEGVKAPHVLNVIQTFIMHERSRRERGQELAVYGPEWTKEPWFTDMEVSIPAFVHEKLAREFAPFTSTVVRRSTSSDGRTTKFLVRLQDGHEVESVLMQHGGTRNTLCISSQIGCRMGCKFCATGTLGEIGNLHAGEMVEQVAIANRVAPVRNVVFMGMGEPMANYEAVAGALHVMTHSRGFTLSQKRITVSTVGVPRGMLALADDFPGVALALSLHAPTQELRTQIVPAARAWPLTQLVSAMDECAHRRGAPIMIEYVLLHKVNDRVEHAEQLAALLADRACWVNVIPYNPNYSVGIEAYDAPPEADVNAFRARLVELGVHARVRVEMGQDISGACGQLALVSKAEKGARLEDSLPTDPTAQPSADVEDLPGLGSGRRRPGTGLPVARRRRAGAQGAKGAALSTVALTQEPTPTIADRVYDVLRNLFLLAAALATLGALLRPRDVDPAALER